jgi:hypothetical protein
VKFAVMFVIIAGLVGFLVSEELTGNPNMGIGKTFTLPEMAWRGTGGAGSSPDSNVSCDIKSTLYVIDDKGKQIKTVQSSMLTGTPLDIVNPSDDRPVSVFLVIPKIYCTTDNENITVKESNLNLSIYGEKLSINESKKQPLNLSYKKTGGLGETALSWFSITDKTIENELSKSSTFTSNIRFDITGNVEIIYDNEPNNKMTIPINQGDIMTKWYYKSIASVTPESLDKDGDGIRDDDDDCVNSKETFNGFEDYDGCPDSVPNTSPSIPIAPVIPVDKNSCNADNKTWYVANTGDGVCGQKFMIDDIFCKEYDAQNVNTGSVSCNDPVISDDEKQEDKVIDAEIKFQVYIKNHDGTDLDFQVADDPSPFSFDIPLTSLVGGVDGSRKVTASFTVEPRLVIDDSQIHSLTSTKQSDLRIETIVKHDGNEYSLGEKRVSNFRTTNGGGFDSSIGFSLGSVKIMASEIQNKVPLTEIPMGSSDYVSVRFLVSGDIGIITYPDGIVRNIYDLDISGADFEITNLKIIRGDSNPITNPQKTNCDNATENVITINGVSECIPKGSSPIDSCEDTNDCANITTPIIGTVGTLICQDNSAIGGGFPCTEEYRINYCGGKDSTFCNVPNNIIKPVIPEITPITDEECPNDGIQSLSVVEGMCLVTGGTTTTSGGETTTSGGNGIFDLTPNAESDKYLLYGAIGVGLLGLIAFLIKRRN